MREDRDNPLALSSKRSCQEQTEYGQELERLRADLEVEKNQTLRAWEQLGVELRHLREEAEKEHERVLREVADRRGCQKGRNKRRYLLGKEVKIKDSGQHHKFESTGEKAGCFCSGQRKLEQLLLTLYDKINDDHATYKLPHRQEFELEKAIFLCHLLEAQGRLLQGTQWVGPTIFVSKNLSKNPTQENSSDPCQTAPLLTSLSKKSKQLFEHEAPGRYDFRFSKKARGPPKKALF